MQSDMPATKAPVTTPVMEYVLLGLIPFGIGVEVYEDGLVHIKGKGKNLNTGERIDGKILKELHIPSERVREYAERVARSGFFGFGEYYDDFRARGGIQETFTLNCTGQSKKIYADNTELPSGEFKRIIEEIIGETLPKSDPFGFGP